MAFNSSSLGWFWQVLDPALLRQDLIRSLWYLHAQPPAFNAFLGAVIKSCAAPTPCFHAIYHGFGVVLHLALYSLARRMGVPVFGAVLTAGLFAFTPASALYEHWLFYTYPVATLLTVASVCAGRAATRPDTVRIALFFLLASLAALTRSALHLLWLVGCLGILLVLVPNSKRSLLLGAFPLLLVIGWYGKNLVLFGSFGSSSWLGLSAAKMAVSPGTEEQKRAWQAAGASSLVLYEPYKTLLNEFPEKYRNADRGPPVRHPALDAQKKSTGHRNFNHRDYVELSERYLADSRIALRHNPEVYLRRVRRAWLVFLFPPTRTVFLDANRKRIQRFDRWVNAWIYGVPADLFASLQRKPPGFLAGRSGVQFAGWFWALLLVVGIVHALSTLRKTPREGDRGRAAAHAIALFTVLFVSLVTNGLEINENNRFRMMVEPLIVAMIASAVATGARKVRSLVPKRGSDG